MKPAIVVTFVFALMLILYSAISLACGKELESDEPPEPETHGRVEIVYDKAFINSIDKECMENNIQCVSWSELYEAMK